MNATAIPASGSWRTSVHVKVRPLSHLKCPMLFKLPARDLEGYYLLGRGRGMQGISAFPMKL
jgi:hypothetical protein